MVAEATQKHGLDGVYRVKQWLESTTFISLPYNVYENQPVCTVPLLNGDAKRFDLRGHIVDKKKTKEKRPLYVESKRYSSAGVQGTEYVKFVAIAYSALAKEMAEVGDTRSEFMWVTTHPFSVGNWKKLLSRKQVRDALKKYPELLNGQAVKDEWVELLADRLWILVAHEKQHDKLMLSRKELNKVRVALKREA